MDILNLTGKDINIDLVKQIHPYEDEINIITPSAKHMKMIKDEIGSAISPDADIFNIALTIANLINKNYYIYDVIIDCPNYIVKHLENNLLDYGIAILYPVYKQNKIVLLIKSCNYR